MKKDITYIILFALIYIILFTLLYLVIQYEKRQDNITYNTILPDSTNTKIDEIHQMQLQMMKELQIKNQHWD